MTGGHAPGWYEMGFRHRLLCDDMIVYSDTCANYLAHLRRLVEALRKANLELHPGKCAFGSQ